MDDEGSGGKAAGGARVIAPMNVPLMKSASVVPSRVQLAGLVNQMRRERVEQDADTQPTKEARLQLELKRFGDSMRMFTSGHVADLQDAATDMTLKPAVRAAASQQLKSAGMGPEQEAETAERLAREVEMAMRQIQQRLYSALQDGDPTRINDALLDADSVAQATQSLRGSFRSTQAGNAIADKADAMRDALARRAEQFEARGGALEPVVGLAPR